MKSKEVTSDFTFAPDGQYVRRTSLFGPDRRGPDAIVAKRIQNTSPTALRERTTSTGNYSVQGNTLTFRTRKVTLSTPNPARKAEVTRFNSYMRNAVKAMPEYTGTIHWKDAKSMTLVIDPPKGRHENPVTLEMKRLH